MSNYSAKNTRLNSIATCAIMVQTLWMLPCMSRRVAPTLNATGPKKDASFCKKPCLASMDPLSVRAYACTRGSCVDSIWLWVRKETFSKPVFGVSKTSISGFVAGWWHFFLTTFRTRQGPSVFFDVAGEVKLVKMVHKPHEAFGWILTNSTWWFQFQMKLVPHEVNGSGKLNFLCGWMVK